MLGMGRGGVGVHGQVLRGRGGGGGGDGPGRDFTRPGELGRSASPHGSRPAGEPWPRYRQLLQNLRREIDATGQDRLLDQRLARGRRRQRKRWRSSPDRERRAITSARARRWWFSLPASPHRARNNSSVPGRARSTPAGRRPTDVLRNGNEASSRGSRAPSAAPASCLPSTYVAQGSTSGFGAARAAAQAARIAVPMCRRTPSLAASAADRARVQASRRRAARSIEGGSGGGAHGRVSLDMARQRQAMSLILGITRTEFQGRS